MARKRAYLVSLEAVESWLSNYTKWTYLLVMGAEEQSYSLPQEQIAQLLWNGWSTLYKLESTHNKRLAS